MSSGSYKTQNHTKLKTKKQPQFTILTERERDLRSFFEDFLDVVLAKTSVASVVDLADERDRLGFRNRHDPDPVRYVTRPLRCLPDPEHDRPERYHGRAFNRRSSHVDWSLWLCECGVAGWGVRGAKVYIIYIY
jgi:hypothetical protein